MLGPACSGSRCSLQGWISGIDIALAVGDVPDHGIRHHGRLPPPLHARRLQGRPRRARARLAVCGSLALEGAVTDWVADHRKHHKYSDLPGDPHSPWRFGTDTRSVAKGLVFAHIGWLIRSNPTDVGRYAPDLAARPR